jgi:hypothetical protein
MREAQDLKCLSYLGFIFVPLSLACSFFSINVVELNGTPTPLWVFIVTAIGILVFPLLILTMSGSVRTRGLFSITLKSTKEKAQPMSIDNVPKNEKEFDERSEGLPLAHTLRTFSPSKVEVTSSVIPVISLRTTDPVSQTQGPPQGSSNGKRRSTRSRKRREIPLNDEQRVQQSEWTRRDVLPLLRLEYMDTPRDGPKFMPTSANQKPEDFQLSSAEPIPMMPIPEIPQQTRLNGSGQIRGGLEKITAKVKSIHKEKKKAGKGNRWFH